MPGFLVRVLLNLQQDDPGFLETHSVYIDPSHESTVFITLLKTYIFTLVQL